jgi:hypothetical protein
MTVPPRQVPTGSGRSVEPGNWAGQVGWAKGGAPCLDDVTGGRLVSTKSDFDGLASAP